MSINRIYKGNCFILGFTDSEMRHNYLPISVNKDKISCTCSNTRFNGVFVINHVNGKHTINIDWNRVIMTQPVENFDLYVKYDGSLRISENIRIEYPLSDIHFNIQLNKSSGVWGTQPNCELRITPLYSKSEAWKYKDKLIRVSFAQGKENTFYPANNLTVLSFKAKEGISIPLFFKFKKTSIKSKEKFNVAFTIDGESKFLAFYFEPAPITQSSYDVTIERLVNSFEYGTQNKPVFILEAKASNDYVNSAQISTVIFSRKAPFIYRNDNGKHLIYTDASSLRWVDADMKFNVEVVLTNSLRYSKKISICTIDTYERDSICIKPGQGPTLRLIPNNSIDIYQNETIELGLEVENILSSPLTITNISSNDSLYSYSGKVIELKGGTKKVIPIKVKGIENRTITYKVYTKEADVVKVSLNVRVKKKEDIKLHPEFFLKDDYKLIVKENYDCNEICGSIVIVTKNQISHNNPFVLSDFQLQSDDFYIESSCVNNDNSYCFSIGIKEGAFSNLKSIPKDENGCYPLSWKYHNQKGVVLIPLLKPVHYKLSYPHIEDVVFPRPDECRKIKLCNIDVSEQTNALFVLDDDQEILVSSPFFILYNNEVVQRVAITEPTNITLCINIEEVEQISQGALNIDSTIELQTNIICRSKRRGEISKLFKLLIHPIEAKPNPKIYFVTDNNVEIALNSKKQKQTEVKLFEQSEDVIALFLGSICIRNTEKIPYMGNALRCYVKNIKAKVGNLNLLHDDTNKYIGSNVEILNGGKEFLIPVFVDYQFWKTLPHNEEIHLSVEIEQDVTVDNHLTTYFEILLQITHLFVDDIYALDLGTTGIVVAKEKDGEQEIVILDDDEEDPIEPESEIISSHTMLIANSDEGKSKIVLSPSGIDYYGKTNEKRFRLVPYKFIIGQERIPYLKEFYQDDNLCKNVKLFNLNNCEVELKETNSQKENQKAISSLVGSLYRGIFKRFSKETSQIKKLVITYPNTYSIENLDSIKAVLQDELGLNLNGQVTFVPESDAVAAYYFDQKIMNEGGFFDKDGNPQKEENVVIYDMGAGTLDLSFISFRLTNDERITANIVNKIGIPLAGNYLGYLIYKTLISNEILPELTDKDNAVKDLTEGIKRDYKENTESIKNLNPSWYSEYQDILDIDENATYDSIFANSLKEFLTCCSETVLHSLIPDGTKIDTIVFSGRASKFSSLRERVIESLEKMSGKTIKIDDLLPTYNCGDCLKTCVAIGALKYQSFFNNNESFRIENKNLYSKIAVVYWGKNNGKYGVRVNFLVDPQSENWDDAEFINGTWCKEFCASLNISDHLPGKKLYYIQTSLGESRIQDLFKQVYQNNTTSQNDLDWAFVNILFKQRIVDPKPLEISLRISKDNKILDRRIGKALLTDTKLLENVEDNILYKRSMWPFITKLNENENEY